MPPEDEELAMFGPSGGGSCPVQYEADHAGVHYDVHYRHGWLTISIDAYETELVSLQLADDGDDGYWSDAETNVYLRLIARAITAGRIESLALPTKSEVAAHPLHAPGPLPRYHVLVCGETHAHLNGCYSTSTITARERAERGLTGR